MTKTIDTIEDININWLNSAIEGIEEFDNDPVKELKVNAMGEGIGQFWCVNVFPFLPVLAHGLRTMQHTDHGTASRRTVL